MKTVMEKLNGVPVQVIIPWREDPSRTAGMEWVAAYWQDRIGKPVHMEVDDSANPFNKAAMINRAVERFPGHVIIVADADCILCDKPLYDAIQQANDDRDTLILPHTSFCLMTWTQSKRVLDLPPSIKMRGHWFRNNRRRPGHGGVWVAHYDLFHKTPMPDNFSGWGYEDTTYLEIVPWKRLNGPMFHIHHRRASRRHRRRNRVEMDRAVSRHHLSHTKPNQSTFFLTSGSGKSPHPMLGDFAKLLRGMGHCVTISRALGRSENYDEIVIWNGEEILQKKFAEIVRKRKQNLSFLEVGSFPQSGNLILSRNGSVGGNLFLGEILNELNDAEERELNKFAYAYFKDRKPAGNVKPSDTVLALFQLENDFAIRNYSPFGSMQSFSEHVERMFQKSGEAIQFRPHPLDKGKRVTAKRGTVATECSLTEQFSQTGQVVGINSTALYEAALYGLPVTALGACSLRDHPASHRAIVAELMRRQFPLAGCDDLQDRIFRSIGRNW